MLYFLNHDFSFLLIEILSNFLEDSFCIGFSHILNKLATIIYSLGFKKQTQERLLHLSFKAELFANSLFLSWI